MNLLGLDLAWKPERNPSALAIWCTHDAAGTALEQPRAWLYPALRSSAEVQACILQHAGSSALLAVDAPLIVRNPTGQRACEAQLNADFRRHHAGAHPSNLQLYPEAETARLADALRAGGFAWFPRQGVATAPAQRWQDEVYPHPAQITLLGRDRILAYKRGSVAERRARLAEYQQLLHQKLQQRLPGFAAAPPIAERFARSPAALRGRALKEHEDALDACFCVLIADRLARAKPAELHFYGDHQQGFIVVPKA